MAVNAKKKLLEGNYTYADVFDIQEQMDTGKETLLSARTGEWVGNQGTKTAMFENVNKDNLGSVLGISDAIAANKKRKLEQQKTAQQGFGAQQSILGGGAF